MSVPNCRRCSASSAEAPASTAPSSRANPRSTAILSGDVMLVRAYELLFENVPVGVLPQVLRRFSQTAAEVCEGQQWDMNFETQTDVTIP
ncbi:MAG: hypothetical protein EOO63_07530, partial [Hymenobacter sp.]